MYRNCCKTKNVKLWIKKIALISFVTLGRRSKGNAGKKFWNNSWFLHLHNSPGNGALLFKDFLGENNVTTLLLPPYSPDLAPADSYQFPQLKVALKERRFCNATDTLRMQRKSWKGFHQCLPGMFQHLYSRWQKYVVAQGNYIKGM
jgi:hypothetical protein